MAARSGPAWAEGLSEDDVQALKGAIKEAEQELAEGKEATKFYANKSTLVKRAKPARKSPTRLHRTTSVPQGQRQRQPVKTLQLPKSFNEFYPVETSTHEAVLYMRALDNEGMIDIFMDGEGGGGMSVDGVNAQEISLNILERGMTLVLTLMYSKVWRSYKIYRDPHTRVKTIEPYHGTLPNSTQSAYEKSQHYFEQFCAKKKREFEEMLKAEAEEASRPVIQGAATGKCVSFDIAPPASPTSHTYSPSSTDAVSDAIRCLPDPPHHPVARTAAQDSDDALIEELLAEDAPEPEPELHPTEHLYGPVSPSFSTGSNSAWV